MVKTLVWCAGDVSNYQQVNYDVEGELVTTFLAPAALNEVLDFDDLIVLIPSTLFTSDHVKGYELLLRAKSRYGGLELVDRACFDDQPVHKVIGKGFRSHVVPHGGLSSPLKLDVDGHRVIIRQVGEAPKLFDYDFNVTFNTIYSALATSLDRSNRVELHIDLTHGSNIMVMALMLVSQVVAEVKNLQPGEDIFLWCAPILARPQPNIRVKFMNLSAASSITREVVSGACAWRNLDERPLPVRVYESMGKHLGSEFRGVYGSVKGLLRKAQELLWVLRSGQAPLTYKLCQEIKSTIHQAQENLNKMMKEKYLSESWQSTDEPWVPVADIVVKLTNSLVSELTSRGDSPIEVTISSLEKMYHAKYYDKVISVAREYIIFLILRELDHQRRLREDIAGESWTSVDNQLTMLARPNTANKMKNDLQLQIQNILRRKGISMEEVQIFKRLRQVRNKLMHGGLSKEFNADIELNTGRILEKGKNKDKKPLNISKTEKRAKEALELIKKFKETNKQENFNQSFKS